MEQNKDKKGTNALERHSLEKQKVAIFCEKVILDTKHLSLVWMFECGFCLCKWA
jgi:hypothetical protein